MKKKIIILVGLLFFNINLLAQSVSKVRVEIIEENKSTLVINFLDIKKETKNYCS